MQRIRLFEHIELAPTGAGKFGKSISQDFLVEREQMLRHSVNG